MPPRLALYFSPHFPDENWKGRTFALEAPRHQEGVARQGEWLLGRNPAADITLAVKSISRRHAAISYSYAADRWSVVDLGSRTGTRVRHHLLKPGDPHPLVIGDRLWLGPNCLHVVEDADDTLGGDLGEDTLADTKPLSHIPEAPPPAPAPAPARTYADSLYLFAQWLVTAQTKAGKVYRLIVAALAVVGVIFLVEWLTQ
jgi:hypothetical protein